MKNDKIKLKLKLIKDGI